MNRHSASILTDTDGRDWHAFVRAYGCRVPGRLLAHLLGQPREAIDKYRDLGVCAHRPAPLSYVELFSLWNGRAPGDADWPPPWPAARGVYVWLPPEVAMLAELVGQIGIDEIAEVLTERLRQLTGDPAARRAKLSVQAKITQIGLQSSDVVGGLTAAAAGREVGSIQAVYCAIESGKLPVRKIGRLRVIPYAAWEAWKAGHTEPPAGYIRLASIRNALGIRSDKLSEFARMGYVPTTVRCNPIDGPTTPFGTWWIDPTVAEQLISDRRAGKPMPWHGKPMLENLRQTYALWLERRHPPSCEQCRRIWGDAGSPATFDDYILRYPPLAFGAKRHLTRPFNPGMTVAEVAQYSGRSIAMVRRAIENGALIATNDGMIRVTRTNATLWIAHHTPDGTGDGSWISLDAATQQYGFSTDELRAMIGRGVLKHRIGQYGAASGIEYVARRQCRDLRERIGLTLAEAARFAGLPEDEFARLLEGVHWRQAGLIPFVTVQAAIRRRDSRRGHTIEEAAHALGVSRARVEALRDAGVFKLITAPWAPERPYLTEPMMRRLRAALTDGRESQRPDDRARSWPTAGRAARDAGVSIGTLYKWCDAGEVECREIDGMRRFEPESVRGRARQYWASVRYRRATPPEWLGAERAAVVTRVAGSAAAHSHN